MAAAATATSMRQRLSFWFSAVRRAFQRLVATMRRDPLPFAGSATALLGIVLLLLSHGHAVPTAPGTTSSRGSRTTVIYYTPEPTKGHPATEPPTQPAITPPAQTATPEWPMVGPVVQGYGWTYDHAAGYWYFHAAWDIGGHAGETARAAMPGTVQSVSQSPTLGEVVVVAGPSGLSETYGGFTTVAVTPGQSLSEGQTIGTLGAIPGEQDGVHLHFGIERGAQPVDPTLYLPAP